MVSCFTPPSDPETKALLRTSLHCGGTNPPYKEAHDEARRKQLPDSQGRDVPDVGGPPRLA